LLCDGSPLLAHPNIIRVLHHFTGEIPLVLPSFTGRHAIRKSIFTIMHVYRFSLINLISERESKMNGISQQV
jgi:hypothetical protein